MEVLDPLVGLASGLAVLGLGVLRRSAVTLAGRSRKPALAHFSAILTLVMVTAVE